MSTKSKRRRRNRQYETFATISKGLERKYTIRETKGVKFTIYATKFGTVDYFPKADRVLVRRDNSWSDFGLTWLKNNL